MSAPVLPIATLATRMPAGIYTVDNRVSMPPSIPASSGTAASVCIMNVGTGGVRCSVRQGDLDVMQPAGTRAVRSRPRKDGTNGHTEFRPRYLQRMYPWLDCATNPSTSNSATRARTAAIGNPTLTLIASNPVPAPSITQHSSTRIASSDCGTAASVLAARADGPTASMEMTPAASSTSLAVSTSTAPSRSSL